MLGKIPWNKNTKGVMKKNSGTFKKGRIAPSTAFKKGLIPWNKDKKLPNMSKENNPNWKGGITPSIKIIRNSNKLKEWREEVFKRDNWIDQKTGKKGGNLHAHHILNFSKYPELRFDVKNGITLSEGSHKEFHKLYGQKNNTKEQLEEFLKTSI